MTGHQINSLVGDLVAMAQAMERLPLVEAELRTADAATNQWITNYNEVKADLEQSKSYAASLEQRCHALEVARDDAELSFLEADERTSRALDFIKATFGNAGSLIQALEPAKAMPEPTVDKPAEDLANQPYNWPPVAPSEAPARAESASPLPNANVNILDTSKSDVGSTEPIASSQGQSEPDPTASSPDGNTSKSNGASDIGVGSTNDATITDAQPKPYVGLRYIDVPGWIAKDDWLAGGGTYEDYVWREDATA